MRDKAWVLMSRKPAHGSPVIEQGAKSAISAPRNYRYVRRSVSEELRAATSRPSSWAALRWMRFGAAELTMILSGGRVFFAALLSGSAGTSGCGFSHCARGRRFGHGGSRSDFFGGSRLLLRRE